VGTTCQFRRLLILPTKKYLDLVWIATGTLTTGILPYFHNVVRKYKPGRQLIVVHLHGSHSEYHKRYPANFAVLKPDHCDDDKCEISAYDNSILFTDYMLSQFIEDSEIEKHCYFMYLIMVVKCIGATANPNGSSKELFRCTCGQPIVLLRNIPTGLQHSDVVQQPL
jgi:hypothetical protein